jgi:hypothetical protein
VGEVQACGLIAALVLDGSFVTATPGPHDMDLVVVMDARQNFSGDLPPAHYNVLSQRRVQKRFGFDIVGPAGTFKQEPAVMRKSCVFFTSYGSNKRQVNSDRSPVANGLTP